MCFKKVLKVILAISFVFLPYTAVQATKTSSAQSDSQEEREGHSSPSSPTHRIEKRNDEANNCLVHSQNFLQLRADRLSSNLKVQNTSVLSSLRSITNDSNDASHGENVPFSPPFHLSGMPLGDYISNEDEKFTKDSLSGFSYKELTHNHKYIREEVKKEEEIKEEQRKEIFITTIHQNFCKYLTTYQTIHDGTCVKPSGKIETGIKVGTAITAAVCPVPFVGGALNAGSNAFRVGREANDKAHAEKLQYFCNNHQYNSKFTEDISAFKIACFTEDIAKGLYTKCAPQLHMLVTEGIKTLGEVCVALAKQAVNRWHKGNPDTSAILPKDYLLYEVSRRDYKASFRHTKVTPVKTSNGMHLDAEGILQKSQIKAEDGKIYTLSNLKPRWRRYGTRNGSVKEADYLPGYKDEAGKVSFMSTKKQMISSWMRNHLRTAKEAITHINPLNKETGEDALGTGSQLAADLLQKLNYLP